MGRRHIGREDHDLAPGHLQITESQEGRLGNTIDLWQEGLGDKRNPFYGCASVAGTDGVSGKFIPEESVNIRRIVLGESFK